MALAATEGELRQLLDDTPFTRAYAFAIAAIGDGVCTLAVPFQAAFERPGGIVNGSVYMAAADVAMWLAIKTKIGVANEAVTVEMKTNFLSSAREETIHCRATVLKLGRQLVYGVAECTDARGKLLAHHTLTYMRLDGAGTSPPSV